MVEQKKTEIKEEKTLSMQISNMIGIGLYQLQFANNDELDITRRKMVRLVSLEYSGLSIVLPLCLPSPFTPSSQYNTCMHCATTCTCIH